MDNKETERKTRLYVFIALSIIFLITIAAMLFWAISIAGSHPITTQKVQPNTLAKTTITEEEAARIAMQHIKKYAIENNRAILTVNAKLWSHVKDVEGSRGDRNQAYPEWEITARFEGSKDYIIGYFVLIWADNGRIRNKSPQGVM